MQRFEDMWKIVIDSFYSFLLSYRWGNWIVDQENNHIKRLWNYKNKSVAEKSRFLFFSSFLDSFTCRAVLWFERVLMRVCLKIKMWLRIMSLCPVMNQIIQDSVRRFRQINWLANSRPQPCCNDNKTVTVDVVTVSLSLSSTACVTQYNMHINIKYNRPC